MGHEIAAEVTGQPAGRSPRTGSEHPLLTALIALVAVVLEALFGGPRRERRAPAPVHERPVKRPEVAAHRAGRPWRAEEGHDGRERASVTGYRAPPAEVSGAGQGPKGPGRGVT
jgi:hypothetical protein